MAEQILWSDRKRHFGLPISFTKYSVSEKRLYVSSGLLNLREEEMLLYRVKDISLTRTLGQRIFGVGTVHIHSSDKTDSHLDLANIRLSKEVKEMISEQVEKCKDSRRMRTTEILSDDISDPDDDCMA